MSTLRHVLSLAVVAVIPLSLFPAPAAAQYGWLNLATHLSGKPTLPSNANGDGFIALYVRNPDGTETKRSSVEFPVGTYTLSRVTGRYQNCDTEATNLTFTIASGLHTRIDVPMSFTTCDAELWVLSQKGGLGMLQLIDANGVVAASCALTYSNTGRIVYADHRRCHAKLAYHANMRIIVTPLTLHTTTRGGDSTETSNAFLPDTFSSFGLSEQFTGQATTTVTYPDESTDQHPDLKLVRTGGTYGGQMLTAQFALTNESAFRAQQVQVTKALFDSTFGNGYNVSLMTASYGSCLAGGGARCNIHEVLPGDTVMISLTQFNANLTVGNQTPYCTSVVANQPRLTGTPPYSETDTTNNRQPCRATNVQVAITLGSNTPVSRTVARGTSDAPVLQFALTPASPQTLNSVTLRATGTGNEQVDVTAVRLYVDVNANGVIDAGDVALATGTFPANDGTVVLQINPPYTVSGPTSFLVTYDFNTTIAPRIATGLLWFFLPICAAPLARRRRRAVTRALAFSVTLIGIASCGGSSGSTAPPVTPPVAPPAPSIATYQATLTGINLSGVDVPGVSLAGATISVTR